MKRFEVTLVIDGRETVAFIQAQTREQLFESLGYQYGSKFEISDIKENEKGTLN